MAKKVLIITSRSEKTVGWLEREKYVRQFCEAVAAELDNVDMLYTTYHDLEYTIIAGKTAIRDSRNDVDLRELQLIHFKNWEANSLEAPAIARYLLANGVPFFNAEVGQTAAPGKLYQMIVLSAQGLPVPDTFYAAKSRLKAIFEQGVPPKGFDWPLVMKANDGSRGDDNHLIHSAAEALDVLTASDADKEYLLQNFIPNDGDFRFLFIGMDRPPLVFHRKGAEGTHLNNTSKGGSGRFLNLADIPPKHVRFAFSAASALGREIGGVDILVDRETGKAYVLEVNGTPALATGYGVDVKTQHFAAFLQQTLEGQEEE